MAITKLQLIERSATALAIPHLRATIAVLKPLPDEPDLFDVCVENLELVLRVLEETYSESFNPYQHEEKVNRPRTISDLLVTADTR